ncbi:MAG: threonine synthase [Chloroflexi bacterium]|nr:threonine synthase [Chloroflexota bacterium]
MTTDPSPGLASLPHPGVLVRYRPYLPMTAATPPLTLGEGDTPLVYSTSLGPELGCESLYFKLEGCNPTGSFKDRGMVVAVAKAIEAGSRAVICASTGNTSASAAAYAARAGLSVIVIIPQGYIALGKLAQALAYGARVLAVKSNFDDCLRLVRHLAERHPVTIVNSINPFRLEGQKTAAFEVVDALGEAPNLLALPVGNAGNITAYWRGFKEYHLLGKASRRPRMLGFQAAGAAPIVLGRRVDKPETVATAIRIGEPASWNGAVAARDESGGLIDSVTDEEILGAYRLLASREGLFVEPASAASVAGLRKLVRLGQLDLRGQQVVCVLTGSGLKDPDTAVAQAGSMPSVAPTVEAVEAELGWR